MDRRNRKVFSILLYMLLVYVLIRCVSDFERPMHVRVFDLTSPLHPDHVYAPIKCRKSAKIHNVTTMLCVHDLDKDVHVSGSIWNTGVWERSLIENFLGYLKNNPDWFVLDIGAQLGQYSLFAAKMSRHVVSVEPFYDNIVRLHKAASLEKVQKKITLFANALSDKKNQLKRLAQSEFNIGGQSLLPYKDEEVKEWEEDGKDGKYLVKTTTLDDLVDFLPAEMTASGRREKAIMKIDIEDFEPYALQKASRMFEVLDICVVFMEWGNKAVNFASAPGLVHDMVEFLSSKGLKPYEEARALEVKMWRNWTWDIVWKKDGY